MIKFLRTTIIAIFAIMALNNACFAALASTVAEGTLATCSSLEYCAPKKAIGATASSGAECLSGLTNGGQCVKNFKSVGNTCDDVNIGCRSNSCVNGVCVASYANVGELCDENKLCKTHASCSNNRCIGDIGATCTVSATNYCTASDGLTCQTRNTNTVCVVNAAACKADSECTSTKCNTAAGRCQPKLDTTNYTVVGNGTYRPNCVDAKPETCPSGYNKCTANSGAINSPTGYYCE